MGMGACPRTLVTGHMQSERTTVPACSTFNFNDWARHRQARQHTAGQKKDWNKQGHQTLCGGGQNNRMYMLGQGKPADRVMHSWPLGQGEPQTGNDGGTLLTLTNSNEYTRQTDGGSSLGASQRNGSEGCSRGGPPALDPAAAAVDAARNCCRMPIVSLRMLFTSAPAAGTV